MTGSYELGVTCPFCRPLRVKHTGEWELGSQNNGYDACALQMGGTLSESGRKDPCVRAWLGYITQMTGSMWVAIGADNE
jgi:hypothetical protein